MENKYVLIKEEKLFLSSFLNQEFFGRTDFIKIMTEKGVVAKINANNSIEYEDWQFDGTKVFDDGTVFFEGRAFASTSLLDILNNQEQNLSYIATNVLKVLSHIIQNGIFTEDLPQNNTSIPGAAGIFVSKIQDDKSFKILVLPGNLFDRCLQSAPDYAQLQGIFKNKGLESLESALFTRAVIAYKAISKKYPFTQINLEKRQADFTDNNFVPLEYEINGIDKKIFLPVNSALSLKYKKRVALGERRFVNKKEEEKRIALFKSAQTLNIEDIEDFFANTKEDKSNAVDEKSFLLLRQRFLKKQKTLLVFKRFYSRNSTRIKATALALILATYAIFSFNKTNRMLVTSKGLTSTQTVQTLLTGIHKADVTIIQEVAKGREVKSLIQTVAGFFVTNKQRLVMDEKNGTLTPAQWVFFKGNTDYWQYGITDLKIDGIQYSPVFSAPRRMDKPVSITEENGKLLKRGDEVVHRVEYNLVHSDGSAVIAVNTATEDVSLRWNGNRWIVRSIKGSSKNLSYSAKKYKDDYISLLKEHEQNIQTATEALKEQYSFVPRLDELKAGAQEMVKKYNSSAAKDFLSE